MTNFPTQIVALGIRSFFWLFVIIYLIISAVLVYHWQKYGGKSRKIYITETVFIIGSVFLLVLAFMFLPN